MTSGRDLVVASTFSDRQLGGITTLIAHLLAASSPQRWTWIVRRDEDASGTTTYQHSSGEARRFSSDVEIRTVAPVRWMQGPVARAGSLAFRRGTTQLAPALMATAYRASLARQWPAAAGGVMWVGTGAELLGFAVRDRARRDGATFAVLPALHPGDWGDAAIDFALYRSADTVFALSEHERHHLLAGGVDADRVVVLPVGPTTTSHGDGARFRQEHGVGDSPLIAFLGRRTVAKGIPLLVESVRQLRSQGHNCTLAVAGPPGDVQVAADASGVLDLGTCSEQDKADLLAAADLLALPSRSESFGLVYLDAWSYGTPVLGGPAPAARELIRDGEDGWIVDHDQPAIEATLHHILSNREGLRIAGTAGRARQRREFTWDLAATAVTLALDSCRRD